MFLFLRVIADYMLYETTERFLKLHIFTGLTTVMSFFLRPKLSKLFGWGQRFCCCCYM